MGKAQGKMRLVVVGVMSLLLLAVCDTAAGKPPGRGRGPVFRPGPPAHAPAHGLRRKQVHGFELTFDAGLGLYVVVGRPGWYHHEGHFYRLRGTVWEISLRGDLWEPIVITKLPVGLRHRRIGGFEMDFDAGVGLYVVVGRPDWYYHESHFYRLRGTVWEISPRGDLWQPVVIDKLPSGLQIKAKTLAKVNGNGNSIAKLNGNANPDGNGNSAVKPGPGAHKPDLNPGDKANDLAKPNAAAGKLDQPSADTKAAKPTSKPANTGRAKPTGGGKKK